LTSDWLGWPVAQAVRPRFGSIGEVTVGSWVSPAVGSSSMEGHAGSKAVIPHAGRMSLILVGTDRATIWCTLTKAVRSFAERLSVTYVEG
jgi:hypothetical protein